MRSITFHYPDLDALTLDLASEAPELSLPPDHRGSSGEWVLAVFKVGDDAYASAAAARLEQREHGLAMVFERRDWLRISAELVGVPRAAALAGESDPAPSGAPKSVRSSSSSSSSSKKGAGPHGKEKEKGPPLSKRKPPASVRSGAGAGKAQRSTRRPPARESEPAPPSRGGRSKSIQPPPLPSTPPPSTREATVLTRTLVPPAPPEIHEADAPDQTLEASVLGALSDGRGFISTSRRGARGQRPSGTAARSKIPRLLLVDADRDMQELIREMLDAIGIQVESVADAEGALDRLILQPFDLVVLDWQLPGMSGIELCRELRQHPRLASIPILFLTAKSSSRNLVDAFAAGADDFVAKPFRAPELGARLLALLRRAKNGLSLAPPGE